ncbi:SRPBCC family protein [Winogradskyella aurantiaca]|uniref:SRPBCC family protein n=1 Tax=Winogradskyella aurantiaca TaxID=2219558 RepID=UPI000E1CB1F6|nr:SRPBCC family protein [Winogradskyella aurantiaca]
MTVFLYVLLGIVVLIIFLIAIAPKTYHVHRSINIDRPVEDVFQYLKFLKNHDDWSPWKKKDPNMTQTYTGTDGEVGFVAHWEGNKDVGVGEQEIKKIIENERIDSQLRFFKPWESESDAYINVEQENKATTRVTWGFSGVNKIPFNVFFLFFSMDKTVGKDFEEGLSNLKVILEK